MKKIGIYPWVADLTIESDKHQILFRDALIKKNYCVKEIYYQRGFPILNALKYDIDVLVLDWVHSFYTSQSLFTTIVKSFLGLIDLYTIRKSKTTIIWNLHNLHRHDGKFRRIERFCFRRLAKKVDIIRVFDKSHIEKVSSYLKVDKKKLVAIKQGPYKYKKNVNVDLYNRYRIDAKKKILLFFGSVRRGKGLLKFVESFKEVSREDYILLIAGRAIEKDLENELTSIISEDVNFVFDNRFIPDEEVKSYFFSADAVVLPYINTLNSGVLILAKTYDIRVLANPNFKEVSKSSDIIGNLFNPEELDSLLATLARIDTSKVKHRNKSEYEWDDVISSFEPLLQLDT